MALNLDLVGQSTEPLTHEYEWRDVVLYALGVGATADELDYVYEGRGPVVLPTFAVVPAFSSLLDTCGKLGADLLKVLHGEQTIALHRPIPPSGAFRTTATVKGIYDKGKGALAVIEMKTTDAQGEPVFDNVASIFVRGEGGFGGDRGPAAEQLAPPEGTSPAFSITCPTSPSQGALYRLSGDYNPLHIDPGFAGKAGFDKPILHGLCTYGFAGRAIVAGACGGDATKLKGLSARFTGVVYPGETLTTSGWRLDDGRYVIETTTQDGRTVLGNAVADVTA
jgi:acyl dehydratase